MRNKKELDEEEELIDINKEFNIKEEDLNFLLKTHEKANEKKLMYHLKGLNEGIEKIESGLFDILYTVEELIDQYEEGVLFDQECSDALEKLCVINDFTRKIEIEFNNLKKATSQ